MKTNTLLALICLSLLTPPLFGQTNAPADSTNAVTTPPPIPEAARKHFVMGTTLFTNATTAADFAQVVSEFKQAANLAPQLQQARYDLALAEEAAGDYSGAMADLKLYQQFKLSDDETRTVQDKIYALEAKQQKKVSDVAAKQAADQQTAAAEKQKKQEYQDKIGWMAGTWNESKTIVCNCPINGRILQDQVVITITGKNVLIASKNPKDDGSASLKDLNLKGMISGDDYTSIKWVVTGANSAYRAYAQMPDFPVNVTVDKSAHQISWTQPSPSSDDQGVLSWGWIEKFHFQLKQ